MYFEDELKSLEWIKEKRMLPSKKYLRHLLIFGMILPAIACVIPGTPSLEGWLCDKDSDCLYNMKCCPDLDGKRGNICLPECKECIPLTERPCYDDDKRDKLNKGICQAGKELCLEDSTWSGACQKAVYPKDETCNGKDDDCNGKVDDGVAGCECGPVGATKECYSGDPSNAGKGICTKGTQTCESDFTWGACKDDVQPETEICNGKDDDCDGQTDEDLEKTCQGNCGKPGVIECKDGKETTCSTDAQPEECNGKDDDCDGKTDNVKGSSAPLTQDCPYSGPTSTINKGICKAGKKTCTNAQWTACEGEITPQRQDCSNGKDND